MSRGRIIVLATVALCMLAMATLSRSQPHQQITGAYVVHTVEDVADLPRGAVDVDLQVYNGQLDEVLTALAEHEGLKKLDVGQSPIIDKHLTHFPKFKSLEGLEFRGQTGYAMNHITDAGLAPLSKCTSLKHLSLAALDLSDAGMVHLKPLTQLESLELSVNPKLTGAGLAVVRHMPKLQSLAVFHCEGLTANDLVHVAGLKQLRHLAINSMAGLNDQNLQHLAGMADLETVLLPENVSVTDRGFDVVAKMRKLKSLRLHGWQRLTDVSYAKLANHPCLEELHLHSAAQLGDRGLTAISTLRGLKQLSITEMGRLSEASFQPGLKSVRNTATAAGLRQLARLDQLERVLLWSLPDSIEPGLDFLGELPKLEYLRTNAPVTEDWATPVAALPKLVEVDLSYGSEAGRLAMAKSQSIQVLHFDSRELQFETLQAIGQMPNLRDLSLHGYSPTRADLAVLTKLEHLDTLMVGAARPLPIGDVERLKKALPRTDIYMGAYQVQRINRD